MATVSLHGIEKATNDFYVAYGEALASWSYIEHRLFSWFWHLSGMPEGAARAVFFSAKGFNARADMLEALLLCDTLPLKIRRLASFAVAIEFGGLVVKKATGYSTHRNSLAHGLGIASATKDGGEILIVQGKKTFSKALNDSANIERIRIMNKNFQTLSVLISRGHRLFLTKNGNSTMFPEFREQVLLLPNVAYCETPSQNQLGRLHQEKLAGRKPATNP